MALETIQVNNQANNQSNNGTGKKGRTGICTAVNHGKREEGSSHDQKRYFIDFIIWFIG
jgi:hypothetical protein